MSFYLCALDSNRKEHVARFIPTAEGGAFEARLAGLPFVLSRESAGRHGLPGSDLLHTEFERDSSWLAIPKCQG